MANGLEVADDILINDFIDLDFDEENQGSVRRIEEGFNKLNSLWIMGFTATRYRYGKWIITWTFNPLTTDGPANPGGKKPITQYGVETKEILKLQRASSPGNFYITNVALKPNASGKGGGIGWKYASSSYNDLVRNFIAEGTQGLITDIKELVIPEALQNHITSVNSVISKMKNPQGALMDLARTQSKKVFENSPEFVRFFKFTKETLSIGTEIGTTLLAPESLIGFEGVKKIWSKGGQRVLSQNKSFMVLKNKTDVKQMRKSFSKKI